MGETIIPRRMDKARGVTASRRVRVAMDNRKVGTVNRPEGTVNPRARGVTASLNRAGITSLLAVTISLRVSMVSPRDSRITASPVTTSRPRSSSTAMAAAARFLQRNPRARILL